MGNRAVVTVKGSRIGVYLQWNGGRESIEAFLRAAKDLGVRDPVDDTSYFYARFTQIVANFFGGTLSVGVESLTKLDTDNGDNGVFVIGAGFEIIKGKAALPASQDYSETVYKLAMERNKTAFKGKD